VQHVTYIEEQNLNCTKPKNYCEITRESS